MYVLGTFRPGTAYHGRRAVYDSGAFRLEGSGPFDPRWLLEMDRQGAFVWADEQARQWAYAQVPAGAPLTTSAPGIPMWAKLLLIGGSIGLVLLGCLVGVWLYVPGPAPAPTPTPYPAPAPSPSPGTNVVGTTCEIAVITAPNTPRRVNDYIGMFVAKTEAGEEVGASGSFEITPDEYSASRMEQTPERARAVQELAQRIVASGWRQTGHGSQWYSLQFSR